MNPILTFLSCLYVCLCLSLALRVCMCVSILLSVFMCVSLHLYVYVCVFVCVCVCVRERERVAKPIFPIPMDTELKICILLGNEVLYFSSLICVDVTLFFFWYIDLLFLLISVLSNTVKLMLCIVPG